MRWLTIVVIGAEQSMVPLLSAVQTSLNDGRVHKCEALKRWCRCFQYNYSGDFPWQVIIDTPCTVLAWDIPVCIPFPALGIAARHSPRGKGCELLPVVNSIVDYIGAYTHQTTRIIVLDVQQDFEISKTGARLIKGLIAIEP